MDGANHPGIFMWQPLYCEALIRLGDIAGARQQLSSLEHRAAEADLPYTQVAATRVRGNILAATGDPPAAIAHFEESAKRASERGWRFDAALAMMDHGAMLRRAGKRRAAIQLLEGAARAFHELGAQPFLNRNETELNACGQQRRTEPVTEPTLTPQERSVAALVATGLSNREVATQLVVSVKTVEFHLGHVFTKLELTSRSQLAHVMTKKTKVPTPS